MATSTASKAGTSNASSECIVSDTISHSSGSDEGSVSASNTTPAKRKYSRKNMKAEKRRMRIARNKRKRNSRLANLCRKVETQREQRERAELSVIAYKKRARTFWEWWRWELQKRREAMINELQTRSCTGGSRNTKEQSSQLQEIDPAMLRDVDDKECFVGRGSFGVVKVQLFRGIQVAVKEFLPRSLKVDVNHEACILQSICHPNLPLLIGVCTRKEPFHIVVQFHGFKGLEASAMSNELKQNHFVDLTIT